MKLILVPSIGTEEIGELNIDRSEVIAIRQNYEASIVTLKNGKSFRVKGIYQRLDDLPRW